MTESSENINIYDYDIIKEIEARLVSPSGKSIRYRSIDTSEELATIPAVLDVLDDLGLLKEDEDLVGWTLP